MAGVPEKARMPSPDLDGSSARLDMNEKELGDTFAEHRRTEPEITVRETLRLWWKGVMWSVILSLTVIMER